MAKQRTINGDGNDPYGVALRSPGSSNDPYEDPQVPGGAQDDTGPQLDELGLPTGGFHPEHAPVDAPTGGFHPEHTPPTVLGGGDPINQSSEPQGNQPIQAPDRPNSPTPMAGSQGPLPSMPTVNPPMEGSGTQGSSRLRGPGLFGSQGGLQGGGVGAPMGPSNSDQSDPLSMLIKQLLSQGQ